jgi:hypothetical protein
LCPMKEKGQRVRETTATRQHRLRRRQRPCCCCCCCTGGGASLVLPPPDGRLNVRVDVLGGGRVECEDALTDGFASPK